MYVCFSFSPFDGGGAFLLKALFMWLDALILVDDYVKVTRRVLQGLGLNLFRME